MVDPATGLPALLGGRLRGVTGANAAAPLPHIGHARRGRLPGTPS